MRGRFILFFLLNMGMVKVKSKSSEKVNVSVSHVLVLEECFFEGMILIHSEKKCRKSKGKLRRFPFQIGRKIESSTSEDRKLYVEKSRFMLTLDLPSLTTHQSQVHLSSRIREMSNSFSISLTSITSEHRSLDKRLSLKLKVETTVEHIPKKKREAFPPLPPLPLPSPKVLTREFL